MSQISPILPTVLTSRNRRLAIEKPVVMGILNLTPDSFFDGGKYSLSETVAINRVKEMLEQGAEMIDIGGASSKPGTEIISSDEEQQRLMPFFNAIRNAFPELWISIDTYHSSTAYECLKAGGDIINDISAGSIDARIFEVAAEFNAPYILMHMLGIPENMQVNPQYNAVVSEVNNFFYEKINVLKNLGLKQIILDPGFGFGKNVDHNFTLLKHLNTFQDTFKLPVLAGVSRKSMINKVIHTKPENALNGTTALHMIALMNGASILRVHDVKEAKQVVQLFEKYKSIEN